MECLRKGRHCVSSLYAHLVFVSKYRGKVFREAHLKTLESLFRKVCEDFGTELVEFNGESDHVHLLVHYPPKVTLSKLVNSLKGVSSRKLKQYHPELEQPAYRKNALWSPSYFAGSAGGVTLEKLHDYIAQQKRPE